MRSFTPPQRAHLERRLAEIDSALEAMERADSVEGRRTALVRELLREERRLVEYYLRPGCQSEQSGRGMGRSHWELSRRPK
ncbi:MAG TPA: hypothetical protein VL175_21735 [Pirellulales bacterium]|jgi:hypothetical protein|nr:hypothetical protein [Pirellulales bacterium]